MLSNIKKALLGEQSQQPVVSEKKFQATRLFAGMSKRQFEQLSSLLKNISLQAGDQLLKEGTAADSLWILKSGELEVYKRSTGGRAHVLATLQPGDCLGELALFDEQTRSASVRALTDVTLQRLDKSDVEALMGESPTAYDVLLKNVGCSLSERLKQTNEKTVHALEASLQASEQRVALALTLAYGMFLLSLFTVVNEMISSFVIHKWVSPLVNVPLLLLAASTLLVMMQQSKLPLTLFGLTKERISYVIKESILWSVGFIIGLTLLKALAIATLPSFAGVELFQLPYYKAAEQNALLLFWVGAVVYVLFVPLQEFIVRGALQSPLMYFLPESRIRNAIAVLISTTLFTALHVHLGPIFTLLVFVPGIFWGILYARQRSLVGVTLSHILIGLWAFHILGMNVTAKALNALFG